MTLYIAWILLYHFQMEWWWYGGAILAYFGHICFQVYLSRYAYKEPPRSLDRSESAHRTDPSQPDVPKPE